MQFNQLVIALTTATLVSIPLMPVQGMDIKVGNIRVQMAPRGEMYINTSRRRIYFPPEDAYYDEDYYDDYYDDDDYCSGGRQVTQRQVQRNWSGRQRSHSSVYTSYCR